MVSEGDLGQFATHDGGVGAVAAFVVLDTAARSPEPRKRADEPGPSATGTNAGRILTPAVEDRAVEVQVALAERGQHRSAAISNLLIAATAELAELTVVHNDEGFELIADITGQPIERHYCNLPARMPSRPAIGGSLVFERS